jgi:hypothetical protein
VIGLTVYSVVRFILFPVVKTQDKRMKSTSLIWSDMGSRITDLAVLFISFVAFAELIGPDGLSRNSFLDLVLYVGVLFVAIRASKRYVFNHSNGRRCLNTIYGNVVGMLVGVAVLMLLDSMISVVHEDFLVIIFSSVTAFFILGTLSPVVKSSNRDIIQH